MTVTKDMRERFEKRYGTRPSLEGAQGEITTLLTRIAAWDHMWEGWQAALSSAGTSGTRTYTLTFVFSEDFERVLLLRKATPTWQAGRLNAPGGLVESGEAEQVGAARELYEETGLVIADMVYVLTFSCDCERFRKEVLPRRDVHNVAVYACTATDECLLSAKGSDIEPVGVYGVNDVSQFVPYLPSLIWLCVDRLRQRLPGYGSAGTSGTADSGKITVWAVFNSGFFQGVFSTRDYADEYACIEFPDSPELEIKQMLLSPVKGGDSLSGKGEATRDINKTIYPSDAFVPVQTEGGEKPRSPYWNERDDDGHCTRCGLYVDPETEQGINSHECPPGFWTPLREPSSPPATAAPDLRDPSMRKAYESGVDTGFKTAELNPPDQIKWWFDEREAAVIDEIATKQGLSRQAVLRRALRTYQLVALGSHEVREINPMSKKETTICPDCESIDPAIRFEMVIAGENGPMCINQWHDATRRGVPATARRGNEAHKQSILSVYFRRF